MFDYIAVGHHTRGITEKLMPLNQSAISTLVGCPPIEDGAFNLGSAMTEEIWKVIKDFPLYQVSNLGRVKTTKRFGSSGGLLKLIVGSTGYHYVTLRTKPRRKFATVHRLVLTAFRGECPSNMNARHLDGIRTNNRLENLKWDTLQNNEADKIQHGTDGRGENHSQVKLNEGQIFEIRTKYKSGRYSTSALAEEFGVCQQHVSAIVRGEAWKHLLESGKE